MMAPQRRGRGRQVMESVYPVMELFLLLLACVELCDAATVVDVYRLIQYDISGVPFGSRLAGLNHHAASLHFPPSSDLSRTVLIIPLRDLNISFVKDIIKRKLELSKRRFVLSDKVVIEDVSKKCELKAMEIGSLNILFTILATLTLLNLFTLLGIALHLKG